LLWLQWWLQLRGLLIEHVYDSKQGV